jgi:hypothetical protein
MQRLFAVGDIARTGDEEGETMERLYAVGDIAKALRVDLHRVLYVLKTRPHITPAMRIGSNRAYTADVVRMVERELQTDQRRRMF